MSDAIFAALLAVSFAMVAVGVGRFVDGSELVVGGVLLGVWAWLVLGDDGDGQ